MPDNETFHGEPVVGVVPRLPGGAGTKDWSATVDGERPRRLSFRVPGRTVARTGRPGTPEAAAVQGAPRPAGVQAPAAARSLPPGPGAGARGPLDAWLEDLDGVPAAPAPGGRMSRFGRIEHARAASLAAQVPEAMRPSQIALHMAFLDHEHAVAASFARARAGEPGLTCNEWARRNPFVPPGPENARDA